MDKQRKKTQVGLDILRILGSDGYRIFTLKEALKASQDLNISPNSVTESLSLLKKNHWIEGIKKGVYAFTPDSGVSSPPHEFEVANALNSPSAISHWTAMHFHHLTQQTPNID